MRPGQVTEPLTVGQLAARAAVRTDTIRYYEREGLLPAPRRTDGEHRRYGPADLDRLLFIRGAQRLGLRLAEIRELLTVRDTGTTPAPRRQGGGPAPGQPRSPKGPQAAAAHPTEEVPRPQRRSDQAPPINDRASAGPTTRS
jgi:DNA-binding transcriptional MerR regulator